MPFSHNYRITELFLETNPYFVKIELLSPSPRNVGLVLRFIFGGMYFNLMCLIFM